MCVLYVSFGSKVRCRTFECVAMGSAVLFIWRSRLLVYSTGSGVNRVQVVLHGFSVRLLCLSMKKTLCRYVYYYRFIVHFPIGLDFLFITFSLHFFLSWTSSLSQVLPYPFLQSLTMSSLVFQLVFCLQL